MIKGIVGNIEIKITTAINPKALAIISHPHPLYGGSMNNKIVHTIAKACEQNNIIAVRYNFRGVGLTDGTYDNGIGELQDLLLLIKHFTAQYPNLPLIIAGFSFGASLSIQAATYYHNAKLITIAPPINQAIENIYNIKNQWFFFMGDIDEIVAPETIKNWLTKQLSPPKIFWFKNTGHFFHKNLIKLRAELSDIL